MIARACEADEWLREHPATVEITGGRFDSAAVSSTHVLPWSLGETARDVLGKLPPFVGVPYGADARLLVNQGGTPTCSTAPASRSAPTRPTSTSTWRRSPSARGAGRMGDARADSLTLSSGRQ